MPVLVGGTSAVRMLIEVALDAPQDRLTSLALSHGRIETWTADQGSIVGARDAADRWLVEVAVTGPFTGPVTLRAQDNTPLAVSPGLTVPAGAVTQIQFHLARNPTRDAAFAAPP